MGLFGGGGSDFDAREAAKVQAKYGTQALKDATRINQITQQGPFGTVRYTGEVGEPDRTQITELNPLGQQQLTNQQQLGVNASQFGLGQLAAVQNAQANPIDYSGFNSIGTGMEARNAAEGAIMDRMNPQLDRRRAQIENQLANQGIVRGSEAYQNAMQDLAMQENDARLGAIQQAGMEQQRQFGIDTAGRQQAISELLQQRQQPMQEYLAMQSGIPIVPTPNQPAPFQQGLQAPNVMGAMAQQAQADASQNNAMLGGLFGLGSAGLMAGASMYGGPAGGAAAGGLLSGLFG